MNLQQQAQQKKPQFEVVLHLEQIYEMTGSPEENPYCQLYENIQKRFAKLYGEDPQTIQIISSTHFVRVPGAVDLFHSLNSSCSFTIDKDIVIAFRKCKETVIVNTTASLLHPQFTLQLDPSIKIQEQENQKQNTFIRAVTLGYKAALVGAVPSSGFRCLVSVNQLPQSMGLGFHSALSIAFAMATSFSNDLTLGKIQLVQRIEELKNQLYQLPLRKENVQMFSINNHLMLLNQSFDVTSNRFGEITGPLLKDHRFVIADCLAMTPKLMAYQKRVTKRKFELQMATRILRQRLNLQDDSIGDILTLQELLDYSDEEMVTFAKMHLSQTFTASQLEKELQRPISELIGSVPYFEQLAISNMSFDLLGQVSFYYREAIRAKQTIDILMSKLSDESKVQLLAKLMDESFEEQLRLLNDDFKEILDLKNELKSLKALGVKVIGEQWGGMLIALVPSNRASSVVNHLQDGFYSDSKRSQLISDDISQYVFESSVSGSALFLDPQYEIWY